MSKHNHTLVDLCSGAGGLSCGLEMAGFKSIAAVEIEKVYAATFQKNNPNSKVFNGDIRELAESDITKLLDIKIEELDLLAAGIPCQGFSINAPIRSLDDPRNHLFKDYITFVKKLRPKFTLIENVTGIVSLGKGTVIEQIYKELMAIGYKVEHKILYAAHYGVPQMRYRTFIIGSRDSKCKIEYPEPTHYAVGTANFTKSKELCIKIDPLFSQHLKNHTTVNDAISDLPTIVAGENNGALRYKLPPKNEYQEILRSQLQEVENHHSHRIAKINIERLKHIPQGGSWRDIPFDLLPAGLKKARRSDHTKRYGRLHPDGICSTVLTKCDPHWGSFFHPFDDRVLSVREAARIQSFPDRFVFTGSVGDQYAQIGNAVPPLMAKEVGQKILQYL